MYVVGLDHGANFGLFLTRSQSYDRELQCQCCKVKFATQRVGQCIFKIKIFSSMYVLYKNALACYNEGVVVVNTVVVWLAPGAKPTILGTSYTASAVMKTKIVSTTQIVTLCKATLEL
jgi:hypothetical protein